ncbi:hypothetical protein [Brevundimonas sp.]|uniref:hypothetical protein n=1 Tax=Brevundimonas sp. TaxID=1871086 RepID=UPI002D376ECF|nr:hypothetical protein [Brevundimonas sp.]HYC96661.1 hypothetical protein [Brevundimonas sp.]
MFHKTLLTLLGGAMALTLLSVQPAMAQSGYDGAATTTGRAGDIVRDDDDDNRARRDRNLRQTRRNAEPSPEQNRAAAQTLLTAAGISCQVSEATLLGVTAEQHSTYEAVCPGGPGYLVIGSTPPQTFNCIELAGQAETSRLRDPAADVGQQCTLPVNLAPVPVLSAYAREAGIDCTVDQASAIGKSPAGNLIYEIGCTDRDGYWLEKADGAWKKTPCWDLALQDAPCRYSTPAESLEVWKTILAGTEAAACDVQQARRAGRDAQGLTVYEVKCGAGDGYFARVNDTWTAQRVHPCATAQAIGGGCTLTVVPAATAPTQQ